MGQERINEKCRRLCSAIGDYAHDLAAWNNFNYTEFEEIKLKYLLENIQRLWDSKCSIPNEN